MPNASNFELGLDPETAKMLGDEEEDKKAFFAQNSSLSLALTNLSRSGMDTTTSLASNTISPIPQVSASGGWGDADRAAGSNNNSIGGTQSVLASIRKEDEAAETRAREREERREREAREREQKRKELRERQAQERQQREENFRYEEGGGDTTISVSASSTEAAMYTTPVQAPAQRIITQEPLPLKPCGKCSTLTAQLASQNQIHEELLQNKITALTTEHDAALIAKTREIEDLQNQMEQMRMENSLLSAKATGRDVRQDIQKGILEMVSKDEMESIKREIVQQEALIQGSQAEDLKKMNEIKLLRQQITELQGELLKHQKITVVEETPPVVDPVQNRKLREEMRLMKEEEEVRVGKLNKKIKTLETRLGLVNNEQSEFDTLKIRELMLKIEKQDTVHSETITQLTEKLNWYIKNQDILSKQDDVVERQTVEIASLKSRLAEADGPLTQRSPRTQKKTDQSKYVGELQKKVKNLEEIIKNKYPNSIPELIRACKPTETEVAVYQTMQQRINSLSDELTSREEEYEKGIRQLRQEADKALLEYKHRHDQLQDEMKVKIRSATSAKVKELERKVEDTRSYYTKKVKELEATVLDYRKAGKKKTGSATTTTPLTQNTRKHPHTSSHTQTDGMMMHTHASVANTPAPMPMQYLPVASGPAGHSMQDIFFITTEVGKLNGEVARLQSELGHKEKEAEKYKTKVKEVKDEIASLSKEKSAWEKEARTADERVRRAHRDAEVEKENLQNTHSKELSLLKVSYEEQLEVFQRTARSMSPVQSVEDTPSSRLAYIEGIKRKLTHMEREYSLRRTEHERELQEAKRLAVYEVSVQKQKMNLVIQMKNNEIERFRINLDALLEELSMLKVSRGGTTA